MSHEKGVLPAPFKGYPFGRCGKCRRRALYQAIVTEHGERFTFIRCRECGDLQKGVYDPRLRVL